MPKDQVQTHSCHQAPKSLRENRRTEAEDGTPTIVTTVTDIAEGEATANYRWPAQTGQIKPGPKHDGTGGVLGICHLIRIFTPEPNSVVPSQQNSANPDPARLVSETIDSNKEH